MDSAEEAKSQVNECEKEIAGIKARLKALGPASASDEAEAKNSLTVTLVKVGGFVLCLSCLCCDNPSHDR